MAAHAVPVTPRPRGVLHAVIVIALCMHAATALELLARLAVARPCPTCTAPPSLADARTLLPLIALHS
eukprot:15474610-Alexandrium_andersonii.AAC.1